MAFVIILMLVGVLLLLAEVLLASGVGVAGIFGLVSLAGASFYAFTEFGQGPGTILSIVNVGVAVVMSVLIVRARIRKKIAGSSSGKSNFLRDDAVSVGDTGMAETGLAPSGIARIGHERVPVTALEGEIEQGADVEVVLVEEGRIYVKPAGEDF